MADVPGPRHTGPVTAWGSYSYSFGPLMAVLGIALLALLLRWAFSGGGSLISRPVAPGRPSEYGVLVPVASPATSAEAERWRTRLLAAGIRVTIADTVAGPRVLVWPADVARARAVLADTGEVRG